MSHSGYTASERRGIITIAILSLILIGFGFSLSLCRNTSNETENIPQVIEHSEMIDSTAAKSQIKTKNKIEKSKKGRDKKPKRYRRPLEEPV